MHRRFVETRIVEALTDTPVVAINGPRQAGKTTLAKLVASPGRDYLTLDDPTLLDAARSDPTAFVRRLDRAIIDEAQRAPALMLALKRAVDDDRRPGRFLITGSANLLTMKTARESLAGRMEVITLLPLARAELLDSAAPSFFDEVFNGELQTPMRSMVGPDLVRAVVAGGFPSALERPSPRRQREWARAYIGWVEDTCKNRSQGNPPVGPHLPGDFADDTAADSSSDLLVNFPNAEFR